MNRYFASPRPGEQDGHGAWWCIWDRASVPPTPLFDGPGCSFNKRGARRLAREMNKGQWHPAPTIRLTLGQADG